MRTSYINHIGFENFRIFRENNQFKLSGINLLVGPNNSGKSSFTKGLLLLKENAEKENLEKIKISFDKNYSSFENLINWHSDKEEISFELGGTNFFGTDFHFRFTFNKRILTQFEVLDSNNTCILKNRLGWDTQTSMPTSSISLNLNEIHVKLNEIMKDCKQFIIKLEEEEKEDPYIASQRTFRELRKTKYSDLSYSSEKSSTSFNYLFDLVDDLDPSHLNNSIYTPEIIDKFKLEGIKTPLIPIRYESSSEDVNLTRVSDLYEMVGYYSIFDLLSDDVSSFEKYYHKPELIIAPFFLRVLNVFLNKFIPDSLNSLTNTLKKISVFSSTSIQNERFIFSKENQLYSEALEFFWTEQNKSHQGTIFKQAQNWIEKFGIGKSLTVENMENYGFKILITNNHSKQVNVADLGLGYAQVIRLIITLSYLRSQQFSTEMGFLDGEKRILILEEPEANLHPKLQSKLADLISEFTSITPVQLIIETHSEYLIRKFQYLVANKNLEPDLIKIHYFNGHEDHDSNVSKEINITKKGVLTKDFGSGFYDEAINWKMKLIKLQNEQLN